MILPDLRLIIGVSILLLFSVAGVYVDRLNFFVFPVYGLLLIGVIIDFFTIPFKKELSLTRHCAKYLSIIRNNQIIFEIVNNSAKRTGVLLRDIYPETFDVENETMSARLEPYSSTKVAYHVKPGVKGDYVFENVEVRVAGRLGLINRQYRYSIKTEIKVYPDLIELSKYINYFMKNRLEMLGYKSKMHGGENEFDFLREYASGDNYKAINWKATARRNYPVVQINRHEINRNVMILIDCGKMMTTKYDLLTKLDYSIDSSLLLAAAAKYNKDNIGLVVFDNEIRSYINPGTKSSIYNEILAKLYNIVPSHNKTNFNNILDFIKSRIRKKSIIFVFSELYSRIVSNEMIKALKLLSKNHTVKLISFEEKNSRVYSDEIKDIAGWMIEKKMKLEKKLIIKELKEYGIQTLLVNDTNVKQNVVNCYLDIR